jgi:uncharacterized protein
VRELVRPIAVGVCLLLANCRPPENPVVVKTTIRFSGGGRALVNTYNEKIPRAVFSSIATQGYAESADSVQRGLAEFGITQADIAYMAFVQGTPVNPSPHKKLRAMASLSLAALHLFVRPGSDIRAFKDLRGKKIGVGPVGTGSEATVRIVLQKLGIPLSDVELSLIPFSDVPDQLATRSLDAEFFVDNIPSRQARVTLSAAEARFVAVEEPAIIKLREEYPFFRPVVIPAGVYGQSEPIKTLGVDTLMICSEEMDDELVYQMLNVFFDSLPDLARNSPPYRTITLDQAPGTSIPLHAGAARFYRERKLFR